MNSKEIVSLLFSSEVKGDLLVLFHRNPGLVDTLEGVALRIGRRTEAIEADLKDFVELGIIRSRSIGNSRVFSLDRGKDRETQRLVAEHVAQSGAARGDGP